MSQIPVNKEYNTFVRGLITEASPFTFPDNCSIAEDNFILNRKGYRERRPGIDLESGFEFTEGPSYAEYSESAISTYKWENVNSDGTLLILIVQIGFNLYFFDGTKSPISAYPLNGGNPINISSATIVPDSGPTVSAFLGANAKTVCSFSNISGKCIITNGSECVFTLTYNAQEDSVRLKIYGLMVRDIWGIDDLLKVSDRPSYYDPITDQHLYNIFNQGWGSIDSTLSVPLAQIYVNSSTGNVWPSNADIPSTGIDTLNDNTFKVSLVEKALKSENHAPKGAYIIDIFNRGASRALAYEGLSLLNNYNMTEGGWEYEPEDGESSWSQFLHRIAAGSVSVPITLSLPTDKTSGGVRCVAAYAGRLFYSGFKNEVTDGDRRSPNLGGYVLYTQTVDSEEKIAKCYQESDPTGWETPDLIATDGGSVQIPEASDIRKLIAFGRSLLVFAANGVWEIRGENTTFSATDNRVIKLSTNGCLSPSSVLVTEDSVVYWSLSGIYEIFVDSQKDSLVTTSIVSESIQSFYDDIPYLSKINSVGVYSDYSKKVTWAYSAEEDVSEYQKTFKFTKQLVYDRVLKSFYTLTLSDIEGNIIGPSDLRVSSIFNPGRFISNIYNERLYITSGALVTTISGEEVTIEQNIPSSAPLDTAYLCVLPPGSTSSPCDFTFGSLNNNSFKDWESYLGIDAMDTEAYIETGYELLQDSGNVGDSQRQKQLNYITVHLERTESGFDIDLNPIGESSCILQTKWGFVDEESDSKWRPGQQVYRLRRKYTPSGAGDTFDYGSSVISTKNKVRGRGRALQLRFSTESGKNCILYGWGAEYSTTSKV